MHKSATDVTVKRAAIEKHMAHNKSLLTQSAEMKTELILLYPDLDVVLYVPGTNDCFSVEKYKESIGKPYNRVNLYLCRKSDHEGITLSCLFSLGFVFVFTPKFLRSYYTTKSGLVSS